MSAVRPARDLKPGDVFTDGSGERFTVVENDRRVRVGHVPTLTVVTDDGLTVAVRYNDRTDAVVIVREAVTR